MTRNPNKSIFWIQRFRGKKSPRQKQKIGSTVSQHAELWLLFATGLHSIHMKSWPLKTGAGIQPYPPKKHHKQITTQKQHRDGTWSCGIKLSEKVRPSELMGWRSFARWPTGWRFGHCYHLQPTMGCLFSERNMQHVLLKKSKNQCPHPKFTKSIHIGISFPCDWWWHDFVSSDVSL